MEQSEEENISPLESAWQSMRDQMLAKKPRSEVELWKARLMFYAGARHAIRTAARSMMSLPLMAVEIREFERELEARMKFEEAQPEPVSVA